MTAIIAMLVIFAALTVFFPWVAIPIWIVMLIAAFVLRGGGD